MEILVDPEKQKLDTMDAAVRSYEGSSSVSRQSRLADSESNNTAISESGVPSLEPS